MMCERDGCKCIMTISDMNKIWIEANPPIELETPTEK